MESRLNDLLRACQEFFQRENWTRLGDEVTVDCEAWDELEAAVARAAVASPPVKFGTVYWWRCGCELANCRPAESDRCPTCGYLKPASSSVQSVATVPVVEPDRTAPDPGEGWRLLELGEIIRQGDEWWHSRGIDCDPYWARDVAVGKAKDFLYVPHRRKLDVEAPEVQRPVATCSIDATDTETEWGPRVQVKGGTVRSIKGSEDATGEEQTQVNTSPSVFILSLQRQINVLDSRLSTLEASVKAEETWEGVVSGEGRVLLDLPVKGWPPEGSRVKITASSDQERAQRGRPETSNKTEVGQ